MDYYGAIHILNSRHTHGAILASASEHDGNRTIPIACCYGFKQQVCRRPHKINEPRRSKGYRTIWVNQKMPIWFGVYSVDGLKMSPSSACFALIRVYLLRMSAIKLSCLGFMCWTITTAAGKSGGKAG